jgi:ribosome-associated protein
MDVSLLHESICNNAEFSYTHSGGPGGQNVNKLNTKVHLRIKLNSLKGLSEAEMVRLRAVLAGRISKEGELIITSSEKRSQRINQERSLFRVESLIIVSAHVSKHRRPTKPSRTAVEKRLKSKYIQGRKKAERQFREEEQ